jgi:GNAT superfamily N-acetyltransferase
MDSDPRDPPAPTTLTIDIERVSFGDPDVVRLVGELQQEFVQRYGGPDETVLGIDTFDDPSGSFFLGRCRDVPVAMGGWRFRRDVVALGGAVATEIKRMYVVPRAQRRGFARTLLAHLEGTAAAAGADVMVLETGMQQPEALALYESAGYTPVDGFGIYRDSPLSRYLGKRLL